MGNGKSVRKHIIRLLYPQRCLVCDEPVSYDEGLICESCRPKLVYITDPRCRRCGKQLSEETQMYCEACLDKKHNYSYGFGVYDYQSVKQSLFRYKYRGRAEYAAFYAADCYAHLKEEIDCMQADAIIPIPLHWEREQKRGYNQAYEFAKELSKVTKIPLAGKIVKRVKKTAPQKGLDNLQRQNNLKKAFHIHTDVVKLKRVILVDDIYTTGCTIDAVAKELKQHGVGEIMFLTLSIGEGI